MQIRMVAFAVGILLALQLPLLPPPYVYFAVTGSIVLLCFKRCFTAALVLSGFIYCVLYADLIIAERIPKSLEGNDLLVTGEVIDLPINRDNSNVFYFRVNSIIDEQYAGQWGRPGKLKLSWYHENVSLLPGQTWQLMIRLKRPHGYQNPGGFDYEGWLFQNRVAANGYVRTGKQNKLLKQGSEFNIQFLRQKLSDRIMNNAINDETAGLIVALGTGSRHRIDAEVSRVLRLTGTAHLLAISGLHVGIVALIFYFFGRWIWSCFYRLTLFYPAQDAGWISALLAGVFYAALAGWSVPTQRALLMLFVFVLAGLCRQTISSGLVLSMAFVLVLLFDPLSFTSPSFILSFAAILIIFYTMHARDRKAGANWQWIRLQCVLSIGLMPLVVFWFQGVSLVSIPSNLIAVPTLGFLIVPVVLLTSLLYLFGFPGAEYIQIMCEKMIELLLFVLRTLADVDIAWWQQGGLDSFDLVMAMIGVLLILLPAGLAGRSLGVVWLLPLLIPDYSRPPEAEVWITLLDVGQGMSAVVQTREHTLLYDAGARFNRQFDMGKAVVLPFLSHQGIRDLDSFIISHGDNDHIGGAGSVLESMPVRSILSSVPEQITGKNAEFCRRGQHWIWNSVHFEIVHPDRNSSLNGNNNSCVLRIHTGSQSILITGDVESLAESDMLQRSDRLKSTIMTIPHHGSMTSSSAAFLDRVSPELALNTAGYRNRYGFPKQAIMARYQERAIPVLNTADLGAITVKLDKTGHTVVTFRESRPRFWYNSNEK